jgi:predicted Zn-dependent protease
MKFIKKQIFTAFLAIGLLTSGCQTVQTTSGGAVGVERQQRMMFSSQEIDASATKAYQQTIAESQKKGTLNRDAAQVARVRAIAARLIPATGSFRADAPKWRWEVNVITSREVNAWCMPGGKIAVYTGLIETLNATDDELAAVMGHEIAHALREHGRERASQQATQGILLQVLGAAAGLGDAGMDLAGLVTNVTLTLPNSREHEQEADRIGLELAARAGYHPNAAVTLWQKMSKSAGGAPPQFLSTHPSPSTRIQDLQAYAPRVMPLYEAAKKR